MVIYLLLMMCLTGCTISFQNVSSVGKATDLVDDNFKSEADVSPTVPVNL